jgi:hypothetical protein
MSVVIEFFQLSGGNFNKACNERKLILLVTGAELDACGFRFSHETKASYDIAGALERAET